MMQNAHRRWFEAALPETGVAYRNLSADLHGIALSGPLSRDLLKALTRDDVSAGALRFRNSREMVVGGVPVLLNRISFSGELGYEIYTHPSYLLRLAEEVDRAGNDRGLRWYGARALMSLRFEKSWGCGASTTGPISRLGRVALMSSLTGRRTSSARKRR